MAQHAHGITSNNTLCGRVSFRSREASFKVSGLVVISKERKAMHTPNVPNREPDPRVRLPRWVALISWPVLFLLVHVAAPWAISLLSTRHGWTQGRPGRRNRLALLLVGAGTVVVSWCVGLHFGANTGLLEMERTPRSLLVRGPYRFTRNPLFLSELAIWLGPLLRQRRGLCWMSDLLCVRNENGGLREKIFSKIVSACFSSQSVNYKIRCRTFGTTSCRIF